MGHTDTRGVDTHDLMRIGRAVDQGQPGGLRVMAWCQCGWHTRPTLTAQLARSDLDEHPGRDRR